LTTGILMDVTADPTPGLRPGTERAAFARQWHGTT
jgi:hypothetical protein